MNLIESLELQADQDSCVIRVRAHPGARKNEVRGIHDGALRVAVTQVPEKGKANQAIVSLLARTLGVGKSSIQVIAGEQQPNKKLRIENMTPEQLRHRILTLLPELGKKES